MPAVLTAQGAATRARIVAATAELVSRQGVARTTMNDVRAATATSKSQLYHYFVDKADLVRAVVAFHRDAVLAEQRLDAEPLDSLDAVARWRYRTVAAQRRHGFSRPCPLGRLAAEVADDDATRQALAEAFARWQDGLATGLASMLARGTLAPEADPQALAGALLAAVQGGTLLATAARDARPLAGALDAAIAQITALAVDARAVAAPAPSGAAGR